MHLHTHLVDLILDYRPVYSFWLFSFERYNGIKGDYGTNQRAVEIQLMGKFTSNQFVKDVPLPVEFQKYFKPVMDRLNSSPAGSLREHSSTEGSIGKNLILSSILSLGPVQKCLTLCNMDSLFKCHGPHYRDCLDAVYIPYSKEGYNAIFDAVDEESVTGHCNRYASRSCSSVNGQSASCIFATVRWFQSHPSRNCLGAPVDLSELEGGATFIPVKRLHGKFITTFDNIQRDNVLVVCPLPRKLHC